MVTTSRTTPTGTVLEDGHQTLIAFAADDDVDFWEKSVGAPPLQGGDAIDITSQHNSIWHTSAPASLIDVGDISLTVSYDPGVYDQIINNLINVNGWITVTFPNGDTVDFVGYLQSFEPEELTPGEQPEASITIVVTNQLSGTETAPVYTASV